MSEERRGLSRPGTEEWLDHDDEFRPLRREDPVAVLVTLIVGPLAWAVALVVAAWLVDRTHAIVFGLEVTLVAFGASLVLLTVLRLRRDREEMRYRRHTST
ncbi:hypothetical protein AB3X52_13850 [Nocardioides sp. DS6]|uniref:DUF2530 domain-containing protein n=1 Tax=Nocardioides eburneus TaxID=3231482 RepID=A0ABV3T0I4_9ACTN